VGIFVVSLMLSGLRCAKMGVMCLVIRRVLMMMCFGHLL
jgi:hypothetical protein